ncbi:MAG: hypothetical protein WA102_04300 [Candidatus Methanoperedens sp.]
MRNLKILVLLFILIIAVSPGCIESQKSPAPNETEIVTPSITEQKLAIPNVTKPLMINDTFETWSRGYYANYYDTHPSFKVILNYSLWIAFLNEQGTFLDEYGYFAWRRKPPGNSYERLEGTLFPGQGIMPRTIEPSDFSSYYIIAAMMGLKGITEGPEIEIKNISRINNTLNVTVRMYEPTHGAATLSSPYHIVIVKRELLPKGNATFVFSDTEGKKLEIVEIKPAINLTYIPSSVKGNTNFTIRWSVTGGTEGEINQTAVLWGYMNGGANMSDYPQKSNIQTGKTPQEFTADFYSPAGGTLYIRVLATVDDVHVYSPEYQISIIQ